jgi:uncharacterized protein (TIGR00251 family)
MFSTFCKGSDPIVIEFQEHPDGVVIPVRANAAARRNEIGGQHAGMLKVSVTQTPEKGKANKAIIALLSGHLNCSKSDCEIIAGETSSRKRILVRGMTTTAIRKCLNTNSLEK